MTARFSTPSATTSRPRLWARSIVERTMTSSSSRATIAETNEPVDLDLVDRQPLQGRRASEQPVPKSSTEKTQAHRAEPLDARPRSAPGRLRRSSR